jgi:hypothetical protein
MIQLLTPALSSFGPPTSDFGATNEEREKNFLWDDFLG